MPQSVSPLTTTYRSGAFSASLISSANPTAGRPAAAKRSRDIIDLPSSGPHFNRSGTRFTAAAHGRDASLQYFGLNSASSFLNLQANMALLPILHYPDPRLHKVARPVAEVNDQIRQLVKD